MSSAPDPETETSGTRRPARVAPAVALALLEAIRDLDHPGEILADEDVSLTLPRRLGMSAVVENQIRRYRDEVRRRRRVSDAEFRDLVRLVVRRPDSEEVFRRVGVRLSDAEDEASRWWGALPRKLRMAVARRRARRRLKALFGRPVGTFLGEPFVLEGRDMLFVESDPGGDACLLVSGLLEAVVGRYAGAEHRVRHEACQARGDPRCRWSVTAEGDGEAERAGEMAGRSDPSS